MISSTTTILSAFRYTFSERSIWLVYTTLQTWLLLLSVGGKYIKRFLLVPIVIHATEYIFRFYAHTTIIVNLLMPFRGGLSSLVWWGFVRKFITDLGPQMFETIELSIFQLIFILSGCVNLTGFKVDWKFWCVDGIVLNKFVI